VVTLKARPESDLPAGVGRQGVPLVTLIEGRWTFSNAKSGECLQSYTAQGFGPGDITWQTEKGRGFKVRASRAGVLLGEEIRFADEAGHLVIALQVNAIEPLDLVLSCHD
jgi:hypothetical protein